jgi:hypothetical protein
MIAAWSVDRLFAGEVLLRAAVAAKLAAKLNWTRRKTAVRKSIALLICADLADISASRWYQTRRKFLNFKIGANLRLRRRSGKRLSSTSLHDEEKATSSSTTSTTVAIFGWF